MSSCQQVKITCPKCGRKSDFTAWNSINTSLDPELKPQVMDRSIFAFKCPFCGSETYVNYDCLYHQMDDHIMIQYCTSEKSTKEMYDLYTGKVQIDALNKLMLRQNLLRIVRSQNELIEKIDIFDSGFDDRVIEIMKLFVNHKLVQEHPEFSDTQILFYSKDENHYFQIFSEEREVAIYEIPEKFYNAIYQKSMPKLPDIRKADPIIDKKWAMDHIIQLLS